MNDLHAVEVDQRFQHLTGHHLNLRLRQPTIQLWWEKERRPEMDRVRRGVGGEMWEDRSERWENWKD